MDSKTSPCRRKPQAAARRELARALTAGWGPTTEASESEPRQPDPWTGPWAGLWTGLGDFGGRPSYLYLSTDRNRSGIHFWTIRPEQSAGRIHAHCRRIVN